MATKYRKANAKKSELLGINFTTARCRLERDLLVKLALVMGYQCFRCGGTLSRETFSVDHKQPWLSADNPKDAFFDLDNIAFSHQHCNQREMVERRRVYKSEKERSAAGWARYVTRYPYDAQERHERYLRVGS